MPEQDPLAHLLYRLNTEGARPLLRSNARVPVPGRPGEWMEPYTKPAEGRRNQAKVMMLRKLMGIPGEDVGDVSQADYERFLALNPKRVSANKPVSHATQTPLVGVSDSHGGRLKKEPQDPACRPVAGARVSRPKTLHCPICGASDWTGGACARSPTPACGARS